MAVTLQRSLLPPHIPPATRLQIAHRYQPARPPALRHPGGTLDFIDIPGGVMLGAGPSRYPATDIGLPPGSVLALYTDGLIEHPGEDIGTGMSRLARTLAASPARSLDDLCDSVLDELCDSVLASLGACARDDIALLLARTTTDDP